MEHLMTFDEAGIDITHHFVGGLYAKETRIPAGMRLTQHVHAFDHLSALMKGSAVVDVDGKRTMHDAPALLTIKAGHAHEITAVTDVVWACLHATDETDPEKVDAGLIA
jgi:quercetin dioxygenase-like cupin family protein